MIPLLPPSSPAAGIGYIIGFAIVLIALLLYEIKTIIERIDDYFIERRQKIKRKERMDKAPVIW